LRSRVRMRHYDVGGGVRAWATNGRPCMRRTGGRMSSTDQPPNGVLRRARPRSGIARFARPFRVSSSRALSEWCRPIEGSFQYIEHAVSPERSARPRRMRWSRAEACRGARQRQVIQPDIEQEERQPLAGFPSAKRAVHSRSVRGERLRHVSTIAGRGAPNNSEISPICLPAILTHSDSG